MVTTTGVIGLPITPVKRFKDSLSLFGSGMLQVSLVSVNTYLISHEHYVGAFFVGFLISLVWSFNVKKIAFGSWSDRILYALGAAVGTILGLYIALLIYK
jgi:hypothetical protein